MNKLREIYLYYCERCGDVRQSDTRLRNGETRLYLTCTGRCLPAGAFTPHRAVAIDFKARIFCTPVTNGQ